jgi:hypothetical protein
VKDPKSSFEEKHGKKENSPWPIIWQWDFENYLDGWCAGFQYSDEVRELEKEVRALSDLQRGIG